jgi:hypothetical protein
MKKVIIAVAFMLGMSSVNAQTFEEGTSVIQLGAGIGSDFGLPLGASYEYGISEKIGIGAYAGYASKSFATGFAALDYKVTYMLFGAKGNYHFFQSDKIDAYGGVLLGYNSAKITYDNGTPNFPGYVSPTYGGVVYGGSVGARYYFTDSIAAFAELGYGLGYLNAGLAYKL